MAIENPSSNHTAHQINGPEQLLKGTLSPKESEKQNTAIKKQAARIAEDKEDLNRQLREKKELKNKEEVFNQIKKKEKEKQQFEEAVAEEIQPVEKPVSETQEDIQKNPEKDAVKKLKQAINQKFEQPVKSQSGEEVHVHATVKSDNSGELFIASIETDGFNSTPIRSENRQNLIINYSQASTNNPGSAHDIGQVRVQIDNRHPVTVSALEIPHEYRLENIGGNQWTNEQVDLWARALQTINQGQRLILPVDNPGIITSTHRQGLRSALGNSQIHEGQLRVRSREGELHSLYSLSNRDQAFDEAEVNQFYDKPHQIRNLNDVCPITRELIVDLKEPVLASDGYIYEREDIEEHWRRGQNRTSPMTRKEVTNELSPLKTKHALERENTREKQAEAAEQRKNQPESSEKKPDNTQPVAASDPPDNSNVPTQAWRASSLDESPSEAKNESSNHEFIAAYDKRNNEPQMQPQPDNTASGMDNEETVTQSADRQPQFPTKKSEKDRKLREEAALKRIDQPSLNNTANGKANEDTVTQTASPKPQPKKDRSKVSDEKRELREKQADAAENRIRKAAEEKSKLVRPEWTVEKPVSPKGQQIVNVASNKTELNSTSYSSPKSTPK